MIGDNGRDAEAILSHIESISTKREVIMAMARNRGTESQAAVAILSVDSDLKAIITFRNILMHSVIGIQDEHYVLLKNALRLNRGALDEIKLDFGLMNKNLKLCKNIIKVLGDCSRQGESYGIHLRATWPDTSL